MNCILVIKGLQEENKLSIPEDTMPIRYYEFITKLSIALVLNRKFYKYRRFLMKKALEQKKIKRSLTECLVYYDIWSAIVGYHKKIIMRKKLLLRYPQQIFKILYN